MQCPGCGQEVRSDETVCPRCGKAVAPPQAPPPFPYHLYPFPGPALQRQGYPTGPLGARIGAFFLDGVFSFLFAIPGLVLFFAILSSHMPSGHDDPDAFSDAFLIILPLYFVAVLPSMVYGFCKDGLKGGASWGKRICGLRVVHLDTGRPCTFGRSCLRQILYLVNVYGIISIIEIIMVLSREDRRRLGDQIAGTMVIPADVDAFAPQPWPQWQPPYPTQPYAGPVPPPSPPRQADSHGPPPLR